MDNWNEMVSFIWSVADLLRGPYRPNQYKDVMLPMTVLRRLDCVLEPSKDRVLAELEKLKGSKITNVEPVLNRVAGQAFSNVSRFTFEKLKGDPENIAANLTHYIKNFSSRARDIIESFGFEEHITKLDKANRLYLLVSKFCEIDLHPDKVSNVEMGYVFEELIRRFNEASNEEAGSYFTPREVIRLMVNLIFSPDSDVLTTRGIVKTLYDPASGTGGMLSVSENYLKELNPDASLQVFGQDFNPQAYAICGSDMMIKGNNLDNIRFGDSFTQDYFSRDTFDYMLANPPFGVQWDAESSFVKKEHEEQGFGGRFGAGLPRVNDGSLLFLQHMISKMKPLEKGGSRLAIVFNASPLFTGGAVSGESNIRRWIIENDWLEAIVALPSELFYNTGINTYVWIVTNRKEERRKGKIQLIDATAFFEKMRRNLGNKRNEISSSQVNDITRLFGEFRENEHVKIFDNADFGYQYITVERPLRLNFAVNDVRLAKLREADAFVGLVESKKRDAEAAREDIMKGELLQRRILKALDILRSHGTMKNRRQFLTALKGAFKFEGLTVPAPLLKTILNALSERDETADVCSNDKGVMESDPELRDHEKVPLKEGIKAFMDREVLPHVHDAWVEKDKTEIGYEINFNRHFYRYTSIRSLEEIEADLQRVEKEITEKMAGARWQ